jgi:predicted site-specific integrase-resolvase
MEKDLIRPAEAAVLLSVHPQTLRAWDRQGKLKPIRLPSGQRRYRKADLDALIGLPSPVRPSQKIGGIYARVSTTKQADAGNLDRQRQRLMEYAARQGYQVVLEALDVASGLNPRRKGLRKAIQAAEQKQIQLLLVEYPDRLARFGYEYLVDLFRVLGVTVVVTSAQEPEDAHTELVKDLLAIVTSFSARLYGARGGRKVRDTVTKVMAEVTENGESG